MDILRNKVGQNNFVKIDAQSQVYTCHSKQFFILKMLRKLHHPHN